VSDITLMRRTVQEFFRGVGKFQLRRQPTSGFKYFQTFNPSNFRMKVGYLFGKLLRSRQLSSVRLRVLAVKLVFQRGGRGALGCG